MSYSSFITQRTQLPLFPTLGCIPTIDNFSVLHSSAETYFNKLKLKRDSYSFLSADSELHPSNPRENIFLRDGLFFGTKHSASNKGVGNKVSIGIAAQLSLGVRFLDFEVTTWNQQLWVVSGQGVLLMTGEKLFSILFEFMNENILFDEKVILNFREYKCENYVLLPTLELLSDLILTAPFRFVHKSQYWNYLSAMRGTFILFAPQDMDFALGNCCMYNWGENSLAKIQPSFNGDPCCVLRWGHLQRIRGYNQFWNYNRDSSRLVWLDICDPLYRGGIGHEFRSIRDAGLLFPSGDARFNIICFSSISANNIREYMLEYNRL